MDVGYARTLKPCNGNMASWGKKRRIYTPHEVALHNTREVRR
jgi:hypothetical protein